MLAVVMVASVCAMVGIYVVGDFVVAALVGKGGGRGCLQTVMNIPRVDIFLDM